MKRKRDPERLNKQRELDVSAFASPQYPDIRVSTESSNPMVLVAQVRQALRHRDAPQSEIDRFTEQALSHDDPSWRTRVCENWVVVA